MSTKRELIIGGIALLFVLLALGAYIGERMDRVKAETKQQVLEEANKQRAAEIQNILSQEEARHRDLEARLQTEDERFKRAATPQDVATLATQLMNLKQPIQFVTPPATPSNPNPQPIAQLAASDTPQVKAYLQECESCKLKLPSLQSDLSGKEQVIKNLNDSLKATQDERDSWKAATKGGTFFTRLKRNAKWLALGGVLGYAAAKAH